VHNTSADAARGALFVVATPIGNLEDFSPRGAQCLRDADRVVAEDTRHTAKLLSRFAIMTPMSALHEHNERGVTPGLVQEILAGARIALVSDAGTPLINDPGYVLVDAAITAGAHVVPIPGPCALTAALSALGMPTDRFVFEGFLSAKTGARQERLNALRDETRTIVCYEAPHRIIPCLQSIAEIFGHERVVGLAKELTKLHEQVFRGPVDDALAWLQQDPHRTRGEFVLAIAGAGPAEDSGAALVATWLPVLLDELPAARASKLLARMTNIPRKTIYAQALAMTRSDE
jgi:16S rRNA (cytidine1402-2'-O)-methyltransferase